MAQSDCELTQLQYFLQEIGFPALTSLQFSCDNQDVFRITSNPMFHKKTKHIEVDYHYVK